MKYSIIFDTNILFVNYDKGGDFTRFYLNATFNNLVEYIEKSDLYEHFEILISEVVWNEMKRQKIEAYTVKKQELESKIKKIKIPEFKYSIDDLNYEEYIQKEISNYKANLSLGLTDIKELKLPTKERFNSIINRAFNKVPPFEGKNKESDKGFKDVLLWESVLEFKNSNKDNKLIFYTKDNIFSDELKNEYIECFKEEIEIVKSEEEILNILKEISKNINKYVYIESNIEQMEKIRKLLMSKDFSQRLLESISSINSFDDIYIIEDIHDITVTDIKAIEENKDIYEAKLKFYTLFNKPGGNLEDIIEKEESAVINFLYKNNTIECLNYEYRNINFDEG